MRKNLFWLLLTAPLLLTLLFSHLISPTSTAYLKGQKWVKKLFPPLFDSQGSHTTSYQITNSPGRTHLSMDEHLFFSSDYTIIQLLGVQFSDAEIKIPFRIGHGLLAVNRRGNKAGSSTRTRPIPIIVKEETNPQALALAYLQHEEAITVLKNEESLLPFRNLEDLTFASVAIGQSEGNYFQEYLAKYAPFQHYTIAGKDTSARAFETLVDKLSAYKVVVVSLHHLNDSPLYAYGIPQSARTFIERLRTKTNVAAVVFGTPYSLKYFDRLDYLVCAYEDNSVTQKLVPQVLFGAVAASGRLPVDVTATLRAGSGISTPSLKRLGYSVPERVGLESATLQRIDQLVKGYIAEKVMPGCQVLVARKGKVVFEKAYGYLTYEKKAPVSSRTLYDLASVTKVAGTLQGVMALHSQGTLDINRKASHYLPELKGSNKEHIIIRDLLLHQAGLLAFQDHWTRTKTAAGLDTAFFSPVPDPAHPLMVAPNLYGIAALRDSLVRWTIQSRLLKKPLTQKKYAYKYSDVGFDLLQLVVERVANQPLDAYLKGTFYGPLGLDELTFQPLQRFTPSRIAPTEQDNAFRGVLVQGTVHDQEAALMGGVAGHAGLFGTANDLAVLMQMNLQKGYYGGKQFFDDQTIPAFTRTYESTNPRGLGWDRPLPAGGNVAELASRNSFGHTGFTGTCVWVDPDAELVYVFLSNRVYPEVNNTKLAQYKVRQKIQNVLYEAIAKPLVATTNQ